MKVLKFGGSSVANHKRIKRIIEKIILSNADSNRLIVFSTFGKSDKKDIKITDLLEKILYQYYKTKRLNKKLFNLVKNKYYIETRNLGLDTSFLDKEFINLEKLIRKVDNDPDKYYAKIVAQGERIFINIPNKYLQLKGYTSIAVQPEDISMITNNSYRAAVLLDSSYEKMKKKLQSLFKKYDFVLVPGFNGVNRKKEITVFHRGGSDYTGSILAAAIESDIYENYTDVNGILRIDPTIVDDDIDTIKVMSYRELRELAYGGAKVVHPGTIIPLKRHNIPLRVRNSFDLNDSGTLIVPHKYLTYEVFKGIALREDIYFLNVTMDNMDEEVGVGYFVEKILVQNKIPFTEVTSSIDSISYAIQEPSYQYKYQADTFRTKLKDVVSKLIHSKKFYFNKVDLLYPYSLIYTVGEGMQNTIGLAAKVTNILSKNGINIITTYQVPDQINMIFGVDKKDGKKAIQVLFDNIFKKYQNFRLSKKIIRNQLRNTLMQNTIEIIKSNITNFRLFYRKTGVKMSFKMDFGNIPQKKLTKSFINQMMKKIIRRIKAKKHISIFTHIINQYINDVEIENISSNPGKETITINFRYE